MGGIIIYSNLFVSSTHLQPDIARGLSTTRPAPSNASLGVQTPKAHPPEMPWMVEWTFIMDWHELEKIPFGIREQRHKGREAGTRWAAGEAWPGCRGPGSLPSPPHACRFPTHTHSVCVCTCACLCTHAHVSVRPDPVSILA